MKKLCSSKYSFWIITVGDRIRVWLYEFKDFKGSFFDKSVKKTRCFEKQQKYWSVSNPNCRKKFSLDSLIAPVIAKHELYWTDSNLLWEKLANAWLYGIPPYFKWELIKALQIVIKAFLDGKLWRLCKKLIVLFSLFDALPRCSFKS